jgi:glycine C-acetyltransferase
MKSESISAIKSLADFYDLPGKDIMQRAKEFKVFLDDIKDKKHYNYKRTSYGLATGTRMVKDHYNAHAKEMIYLSANDYLGLTSHPKVIEGGIAALRQYGSGSGSAPLLGGTTDLHLQLEKEIAHLKGFTTALIHASGYASNASAIMAMLGKEDVAITDMFAHASLIDGCKNTNQKFFKHNDLESLEHVLSMCCETYRTKLIIVDGVYSMDGDIAPLDKIVALAKQFGAYVMVDDAHATGVLGATGRGSCEHFNVYNQVDIVCGTFSKSLASVGGFIAAKPELIELLQFYSRGYMFASAPTPAAVGAALAAIQVTKTEPQIRQNLWANITYFKTNLLQLGFNIGSSQTAIFPIITGNDLVTKEICRELNEMGIYVNPVLYPAVPRRFARVRISLSAAHTKAQLDVTLNALEYLGKKYKIIA